MTGFLIFIIALLLLALIACINVISHLASETRYQTERKNYWYEQASEYRILWQTSLLDDEPDGDDSAAIDAVPYEKEEKPEPVKAMAKTVGR